MRISDWSSDVCSSDLLLIVDEFEMPRLVKGLDIGVSDYLMKPIDANELLARVRIQVRRRRYQDRLRTNYERRDRKSVVSGKSVSVRVDLGGRRIIKKQSKE